MKIQDIYTKSTSFNSLNLELTLIQFRLFKKKKYVGFVSFLDVYLCLK